MKQDIDTNELKRDFENLLSVYWYTIRTRDSSRILGEQKKEMDWAIELMKKYGIG